MSREAIQMFDLFGSELMLTTEYEVLSDLVGMRQFAYDSMLQVNRESSDRKRGIEVYPF